MTRDVKINFHVKLANSMSNVHSELNRLKAEVASLNSVSKDVHALRPNPKASQEMELYGKKITETTQKLEDYIRAQRKLWMAGGSARDSMDPFAKNLDYVIFDEATGKTRFAGIQDLVQQAKTWRAAELQDMADAEHKSRVIQAESLRAERNYNQSILEDRKRTFQKTQELRRLIQRAASTPEGSAVFKKAGFSGMHVPDHLEMRNGVPGLLDWDRALRQSALTFDTFTGKVKYANPIMRTFHNWVTQIKGALNYAVFLLLIAGVAALTNEIVQFNSNIREFNTLAKLGERELRGVESAVINLSRSVAKSSSDLAGGLRDIASSMDLTVQESLKLLAVSADLAVGGFVETATATKALVSVLNAYKLNARFASVVSNNLFEIMNYGIVTIQELSDELGKVTPIAAAAGIGFSEVGAAIALMTKNGNSAARSATALARIINNILSPSGDGYDKMVELLDGTGFSLDAQMIAVKGFTGAIEAMNVAVANYLAQSVGMDSKITSIGEALRLVDRYKALSVEGLGEMFTDKENLTAVTQFLGSENYKEFVRIHEEIRNGHDATRSAVDEANKSFKNQFIIIKNDLVGALTELGLVVIPIVLQTLRGLQGIFHGLIYLTKEFTGTAIALGIAVVALGLKFSTVAAAASRLGAAWAVLAANPFAAAIVGGSVLLGLLGNILSKKRALESAHDYDIEKVYRDPATRANKEIEAFVKMEADRGRTYSDNVIRHLTELREKDIRGELQREKFMNLMAGDSKDLIGIIRDSTLNGKLISSLVKSNDAYTEYMDAINLYFGNSGHFDLSRIHEFINNELLTAQMELETQTQQAGNALKAYSEMINQLPGSISSFTDILDSLLKGNFQGLSSSTNELASVLSSYSQYVDNQRKADIFGGIAKFAAEKNGAYNPLTTIYAALAKKYENMASGNLMDTFTFDTPAMQRVMNIRRILLTQQNLTALQTVGLQESIKRNEEIAKQEVMRKAELSIEQRLKDEKILEAKNKYLGSYESLLSSLSNISDANAEASPILRNLREISKELQVAGEIASFKENLEIIKEGYGEFQVENKAKLQKVLDALDDPNVIESIFSDIKSVDRLEVSSNLIGSMTSALQNVVTKLNNLGLDSEKASRMLRNMQKLEMINSTRNVLTSLKDFAETMTNGQTAASRLSYVLDQVGQLMLINTEEFVNELLRDGNLEEFLQNMLLTGEKVKSIAEKISELQNPVSSLVEAFRESTRGMLQAGVSANELSEALRMAAGLQIQSTMIDLLNNMKNVAEIVGSPKLGLIENSLGVLQNSFLAGSEAFLGKLLSFGSPEEMAEIFAKQNYISQNVNQSVVIAPYIQIDGAQDEEAIMKTIDKALTDWANQNGVAFGR